MASAPVDALPDQSQNLIDVDMECLNDKSGDGDVVSPEPYDDPFILAYSGDVGGGLIC